MGHTFFNRPFLHGVGDDIGYLRIEGFPLLSGPFQRLIRLLWQAFFHHGFTKDHTAKHFRDIPNAHQIVTPSVI